jgi:predicted transcriptional regulator
MTIWEDTKCVDLLKGQAVIEIDSNTSVEAGCETLVKHGISSAPVFSKVTKSYVGMLDYRDVVAFVLVAFKRHHLPTIKEESEVNENSDSIRIDNIVRSAMSGGETKSGVIAGTLFVLIRLFIRSVFKESILQYPKGVSVVCNHRFDVECSEHSQIHGYR